MIEFVPVDIRRYKDIAAVERDAYDLHTGLYDELKELKTALGRHAARRYSFLVKDGEYKGFCIASLQSSVVEQGSLEALYVSDLAVRKESQGLTYGLLMAEELLRRAVEDAIEHIEFHALGSTSYHAITTSRHTQTYLERYGYDLQEVGGSDIYSPDGKNQESLHLISVKKMVSYPL